MKMRTAIIGMGKMGHIRKQILDAHQDFEVVALCDINQAVSSEFPDISFSTNWHEVISSDVDVVFICTYNNVAPDIVCEALGRNVHVFCEKPPGRSVDDVKRMIRAESSAKGKIVKFGFNHRFHYGIMEAKAIVDSGRYGKILWARGIYGKAGGIDYENSWRASQDDAGGGILLDQGIHMLDLLQYFLGDFVEVKSLVERCFWKHEGLEDNVFALLRTEDRKNAMIHSSSTHWKHKFSLDLFLEDGYVWVNGILSSTRSYGDESITFAKKQFEDEAHAFGKPREETIYFDRDDSWKLEIDDFCDCVVGKKRQPNGSTEDALRVMQLIEEIYKADLQKKL